MDRYDAYTIASQQFTIMQTSLNKDSDVARLIDDTLVACITRVSCFFSGACQVLLSILPGAACIYDTPN